MRQCFRLGRDYLLLGGLGVICACGLPVSATDTPGFADRTDTLMLKLDNAATCWCDFNNDGWPDLYAGSIWLNDQGHKFVPLCDAMGCGVAADYNNDGCVDLFFTTVYGTASFNRENFPVLYRNEGDFTFSDATAVAGLARQSPTSQGAWADYDRDGDVDLVTAGRLFENGGSGHHWLAVRLSGNGTTMNRSAIGTQVRVKLEGRTLTRQVEAGTGEGNQNELVLHFGLGTRATPVDLEIFWPAGKRQSVVAVNVDQPVEYCYDDSR